MIRKMKRFKCLSCGVICHGRADDVKSERKKYCSVSCSSRGKAEIKHKLYSQFGTDNPNYKGDDALTLYEQKLRQKKRYPQRVRARQLVTNALVSGSLEKEPCEICQRIDAQAHHDDYSKPLEVRWLCRKHHSLEHNGKGTGT